MSTVRRDLENALASWSHDGREADAATGVIFASVIAVMRKRFPKITVAELELLLADTRNHTLELLDGLITDSIDLNDAINIVATRFFGRT